MYTNSLPVNASEPYSLDIFQPSKNSPNLKKICVSKAAQQYPAYSNVQKNYSTPSLRRRSCTGWSDATDTDFAPSDSQRPIQSLFGDMKKKPRYTLRRNKDVIYSSWGHRWNGGQFTQPCRRQAFEALHFPCAASFFALPLPRPRSWAGWQAGGKREAGRGDASLGSRIKLYCKGSASSLSPNGLEQALDSGL